jgi:mono/diheme cytochrome c family protein/glucose/arabinose dehydrogenase
VLWQGQLVLKETDAIRFSAFLGGELKLVIDGVEVFDVRSAEPSQRIESTAILRRPAGTYALEIQYRSLPDTPARVQIWWEGESFSRAPLPASRLQHAANGVPPRLHFQEKAEEGRELVRQFGCAQCHAEAFPGVAAARLGPSLEKLASRVQRDWMVAWLRNPSELRSQARMPRLFTPDRRGFVEISLIVDFLLRRPSDETQTRKPESGDHRAGRQAFVGLGCATCHLLPEPSEASSHNAVAGNLTVPRAIRRSPLDRLADRFTLQQLANFIADPYTRYADGRMPRLPVEARTARDIAAYLLMWSKPAALPRNEDGPPRAEEIKTIGENLQVAADPAAIGAALVRQKGCVACHSGLTGEAVQTSLRLTELTNLSESGCLNPAHLPYFSIPPFDREKIAVFVSVAGFELHKSPFDERQQLLKHSGCFVCHQADGDSPPAIEQIGQALWTPHLMRLPYQRTPRLTEAWSKYTRSYLLEAIRDGVRGVRPSWYSYRMPAFGEEAEEIVQALAERDGELIESDSRPDQAISEPTLSMFGAGLVGFEGYSCVSCHIWSGTELTGVDPGAVGPELTSATRRIRRDWFKRWLENPARMHPGTPMPAFFPKGEPAPISAVLNGDALQQKEAIWSYLSLGTNAPNPQPRPLIPVHLPAAGEPPIFAQIPIRIGGGELMESLCVQYGNGAVIVYDLGKATLHSVRMGSQILRNPNGWRGFSLSDASNVVAFAASPAVQLIDVDGAVIGASEKFLGYERIPDGVKIRFRLLHKTRPFELAELLKMESTGADRQLRREWHGREIPPGCSLQIRSRLTSGEAGGRDQADVAGAIGWTNLQGQSALQIQGDMLNVSAIPEGNAESGSWAGGLKCKLPKPGRPNAATNYAFAFSQNPAQRDAEVSGSLERPGYRALRYAMPKTSNGEDRIMPSALAVDPRSGRLFVASLKLGEIFALHDPKDDGVGAVFKDYAQGLFQDAYAMLHEGDALYALHRRNLTRITDEDHDGVADRFDRVAALPHALGNKYDWAYGLVRDQTGGFVLSFAPHADDRNLPGMGGVLRLTLDRGQASFAEIAFGLRNAVGWASGPGSEVFFSDNQGEWVPANKLCHVVESRFYGYPNSARPEATKRKPGETAIWVPYAWAKSINGIAYSPDDGTFGPFGGQFFMAELMHGGAIIRANVEKINGVYQGACFPFWGRGLLGPLVLAFDPKGRLYVGSITQPAWMAQPDRGALFRIEFTRATPFEIQSIHALPSGFRLRLTQPVSPASALEPTSYSIEHYRYEFTGAYGSPELDRTPVQIKGIELIEDEKAVDVATDSLIPGRIYSVSAKGLRNAGGEPLVHPTGVYTLNQVPDGKFR